MGATAKRIASAQAADLLQLAVARAVDAVATQGQIVRRAPVMQQPGQIPGMGPFLRRRWAARAPTAPGGPSAFQPATRTEAMQGREITPATLDALKASVVSVTTWWMPARDSSAGLRGRPCSRTLATAHVDPRTSTT